MCYHKSLFAENDDLMAHYAASFESITEELEIIRERFSILMSKDTKAGAFTKEETEELKWCDRALKSFTSTGYQRFHENGYDYLPAPVVTAGAPGVFKLFRWGLIPFNMPDRATAYGLRHKTLNCIAEEMYIKPAYMQAAKNGQRCLIPVSGFYEWRWLDPDGKNKIPYFISHRERPLISLAGIYSRWKDQATGGYYYSYSVLTTKANPLMEYVHNVKKRMPVIIPREYEKDWLNRSLSKDDVLALCQPVQNDLLKAHTVSKLLTSKNTDTNVRDVMKLHRYEEGVLAEI
jgi:putative SOS response-associated peptidase YedK